MEKGSIFGNEPEEKVLAKDSDVGPVYRNRFLAFSSFALLIKQILTYPIKLSLRCWPTLPKELLSREVFCWPDFN